MLKKLFLKKISSILGIFIVCGFSLTLGAILLRVVYSAFTQPTKPPTDANQELGALTALVGKSTDTAGTATVFGRLGQTTDAAGANTLFGKIAGVGGGGKIIEFENFSKGDSLYSMTTWDSPVGWRWTGDININDPNYWRIYNNGQARVTGGTDVNRYLKISVYANIGAKVSFYMKGNTCNNSQVFIDDSSNLLWSGNGNFDSAFNFNIPVGVHTLVWRYVSWSSCGSDYMEIDWVVLENAVPEKY